MNNTDLYIRRLLETNPVREPLLRTIIQSFQLPKGSSGLDAGCGIGLQCLQLLEAIGTNGHIIGLDILPELLSYGTEIVRKAGIEGQIAFRQGNIDCLPFENDSFDWVWSADCIGYPAGELGPSLDELIRVVRPGGSIFLLGWSSQQLLPGYPLLEARLNGTCSGYLPFLAGKSAEQNFMRVPAIFQKAGLENLHAQTFVGDICAPLKLEEQTAITSLFEMLWGMPQTEVAPGDWLEYQRLCDPASPDFILNLPGYYGFFTYSLFRGQVPHHKNNRSM